MSLLLIAWLPLSNYSAGFSIRRRFCLPFLSAGFGVGDLVLVNKISLRLRLDQKSYQHDNKFPRNMVSYSFLYYLAMAQHNVDDDAFL